jgi:hypothetical protein
MQDVDHHYRSSETLLSTAYVFSILANLWALSLTTMAAWCVDRHVPAFRRNQSSYLRPNRTQRRFIRRHIQYGGRMAGMASLFAILIESSLAYTILWVRVLECVALFGSHADHDAKIIAYAAAFGAFDHIQGTLGFEAVVDVLIVRAYPSTAQAASCRCARSDLQRVARVPDGYGSPRRIEEGSRRASLHLQYRRTPIAGCRDQPRQCVHISDCQPCLRCVCS